MAVMGVLLFAVLTFVHTQEGEVAALACCGSVVSPLGICLEAGPFHVFVAVKGKLFRFYCHTYFEIKYQNNFNCFSAVR